MPPGIICWDFALKTINVFAPGAGLENSIG
jgi:hypothetical protein